MANPITSAEKVKQKVTWIVETDADPEILDEGYERDRGRQMLRDYDDSRYGGTVQQRASDAVDQLSGGDSDPEVTHIVHFDSLPGIKQDAIRDTMSLRCTHVDQFKGKVLVRTEDGESLGFVEEDVDRVAEIEENNG
jgi:hypothetical protein